jgi:hypothetical protein
MAGMRRFLDGGLVLIEQREPPFLTVESPGAEGNEFGFESSYVVKLGKPLVVQPKRKGHWTDPARTPLGLIPESDGTVTLYYTGFSTCPQTTRECGGE